jgi:hypothetical protein
VKKKDWYPHNTRSGAASRHLRFSHTILLPEMMPYRGNAELWYTSRTRRQHLHPELWDIPDPRTFTVGYATSAAPPKAQSRFTVVGMGSEN